MSKVPRLTPGVRTVLQAMLKEPERLYVIQDLESDGTAPRSVLYDVFERLERVRWLTRETATSDSTSSDVVPTVRCYRLTEFGRREARRALDSYEQRQRKRRG